MVIRIATFSRKPDVPDDKGHRAAWHARDTKTGKVASISVWEDMASMMAMKDRTPPGGPILECADVGRNQQGHRRAHARNGSHAITRRCAVASPRASCR